MGHRSDEYVANRIGVLGECVFPEALSDLWQCVDPAPSEHINEAAMNFVFTAFFVTSEHINEAAMNFVFTLCNHLH